MTDLPMVAAAALIERQVAERVQRSGTSFYVAMRLLPSARRHAMFAIYAFCRDVDDIADEPAPVAEKLRRLDLWREEVARLYEGTSLTDPISRALAPRIREFGLRRQDFIDVIDGMAMDAATDIVAPTMAELDLYCDRVASAVGRLSVCAFGADGPAALKVAHHLGRALQLTNILRDLAEDATRGRLYLPRDNLARHGLAGLAPAEVLEHGNLRLVCREVAEIARLHFAQAGATIRACPRAPMRPARLIEAMYRALLDRLVAKDWADPRSRVSLPKWRKIWLVLRHGMI